MSLLTPLPALLERLLAARSFVVLASTLIPQLVERGLTSQDTASQVLDQLRGLKEEIQLHVETVRKSMEAIQDRLEVLGQFLLLHRRGLTASQVGEVERLLAGLRGKASVGRDGVQAAGNGGDAPLNGNPSADAESARPVPRTHSSRER